MTKQRAGRYSQVARILRIFHMLDQNPEGLTVPELHARIRDTFPVGRRTIYRDLEALDAAGFPVVAVKSGETVRWKLANRLK